MARAAVRCVPSYADALEPSEVSSRLAKLRLVGHVLACPACRTEAACELPSGITALACKGCEAQFFAQVPPPKEKRQPGRKQASHHAPRPAGAAPRRPPTEYNLFQRRELPQILAAAPSAMTSQDALSVVAEKWRAQWAAREADAEAGAAEAEEQPVRPRQSRSRQPQAEAEQAAESEPESQVPCCARGHPLQLQRARRRYGALLCDCCETWCIEPGDHTFSCSPPPPSCSPTSCSPSVAPPS